MIYQVLPFNHSLLISSKVFIVNSDIIDPKEQAKKEPVLSLYNASYLNPKLKENEPYKSSKLPDNGGRNRRKMNKSYEFGNLDAIYQRYLSIENERIK